MFRVLVGAHPCKMSYNNELQISSNHWLSKIFDKLILAENTSNKSVTIETADIINNNINSPDYKVNLFEQTEFSTQKQSYYDVVCLPDAGGLWYYCQDLTATGKMSIDTNEHLFIKYIAQNDYEKYIEIIQNMINVLYSLVKPNGVLWLSKFIDDNFLEIVIDHFNSIGAISVDTNYLNFSKNIMFRKPIVPC